MKERNANVAVAAMYNCS